MKGKSGIKVLITLVIIALAVIFSITPLSQNIKLGLDLQGGAQVVLLAKPEQGQSITSDDMEKLTQVMRKRVDEFGVTEPIIQREGSDRLIIELAGVDNPEKAIDILGRTAKLEFRDPSGQVIVSGSELKSASAQIDQQKNEPYVALEFSEEGAKKFGSATARLVGQVIAIYLDNEIIQEPVVQGPIMDGHASISGGYETLEDASNIAALLRGGALPVDIEIMSKRTVGPSLGQDSLDKSFTAITIGMLILVVFMIAYYRLPGVLAIISLIVYGLLLLWAMIGIGATLTLPGIAGFVLSIGIAVDANIIIYERIKEELRNGKSLNAGISAGFKRAFWTIFDSNITTLIAALVLFKVGTGSVQGFAITLTLGIIASMFTALVFTRFMIRWVSNIKGLQNRKLYGDTESRRG
ncbi:MAG: protein translocase subunit SecD [Bacillota bacterium]|jgi:preprotein translocase subunit SecD